MKLITCKEEMIRFVMNSSDADNRIIATFIANMQAKKSTTVDDVRTDDRQIHKPFRIVHKNGVKIP